MKNYRHYDNNSKSLFKTFIFNNLKLEKKDKKIKERML